MLKSDAIAHFGSQAKLARELNRSESTVSEWPDVIPMGTAAVLELLTRRRVRVDWSRYPDAPPALRTRQPQ